jgi:hypothetical protein
VQDIMDLLRISLQTFFLTLDEQIFQQKDGTPIGKSISGPLAGIYMNWFEEKFVYKYRRFKPVFWKRMRDDVLLIWDDDKYDFQGFVSYLNGINEKIQFTYEEEINGSIPFLDLMLTKEGDKIKTKVYRKPTHTQSYLNWRSNHPKNMLLGVLKGLIHRAHCFCDDESDLKEELQLLLEVFIINGFPDTLVEQTINRSCKTEVQKMTDRAIQKLIDDETEEDESDEDEYFNVIHAPYVQGFSERLQHDLRPLKIGFVPKKMKTLHSELSRRKPKRHIMKCKDVVYQFECRDCKMKYIGETGQRLESRREQHQRDIQNGIQTNAFFQHLQKHKKHSIDWENPKILSRERHWESRRIKESLYINAMDPQPKITKLMNLEKGKDLDTCWNIFNSEIRKKL